MNAYGPPDKAVILFDYDPSRGAAIPTRLLEGFEGYLQCGGLSSYNAFCAHEIITRLGCFDHARRKFSEAIKGQPKGKKVKTSVADVGFAKINALLPDAKNKSFADARKISAKASYRSAVIE